MDPIVIGLVSILILLIFMALGFHISVCMGLSGIIGFSMIVGFKPAMHLAVSQAFSVCSNYEFSVIPLFMLMGLIIYSSGIANTLYDAMQKLFGRFPGGLLLATIFASAVFGAANGSTIAAAVTFTKIGAPEMIKKKYSPKIACGAIAASGTLSILIPPSTLMVIYAIITEQSIGKCLIAGVIPGIITMFMYVILVWGMAIWKPHLLPRGPVSTFKEKMLSLKSIWEIPVLVIFVLGGLYSGVFTATEAGAIGAFLALIVAIIAARKRNIYKMINESLNSTMGGTIMIFVILIGAFIFSSFLSVSRLPVAMTEVIGNSGLNKIYIVLLILLMLFVLGTFMSSTAVMVITMPIVLPIITSLGYDPIWFSVISIKMCEIGVLTPPVGLNVYAVKGAIGAQVPLEDIFKGVMPFLFVEAISVILFVAFPSITLFLPNAMN